jgi:hypothetical protein
VTMLRVDVDTHGPLFDGRAQAAVHAFLDEAKQEVAQQGLADVHQLLDLSIRNPTPYYETQILTERVGADWVVHDRGIVYGPWLEGVGSRNKTTRFKGYWSFRRVTTVLRMKAHGIAERVLHRYLGRMQ